MAHSEMQSDAYLSTLKNVKQIGTMPDNDKVYIEDYTVTYLSQMGNKGKEDCLAALFGIYKEADAKRIYTIYGAIGVPVNWGNLSMIPENAVSDIIAKKREHFSDMFFLGWAFLMCRHTKPNMDSFYRGHLESAFGRPRLLMLMEAGSTECNLFCYHTDKPSQVSGYSIFYTSNEAMQKFLIDWHEETSRGLPEQVSNGATDSCRLSLAERKQTKTRGFVSNATLVLAVLLLIVVTCVGITTLNQYSKMKAVEDTLLKLAETISIPEEEEMFRTDDGEFISIEAMQTIQAQEAVEFCKNAQLEQNSEEAVEDLPSEKDRIAAETETENDASADLEEAADQNEPVMTGREDITQQREEDPIVALDSTSAQNPFEEKESIRAGEYVIEKGDTLNRISKRFYGSILYVEQICAMNHIEDKDSIYYGQKIHLPDINTD